MSSPTIKFCKTMRRFMRSAGNEFKRRGLRSPGFTVGDLGDYYRLAGVYATGRGFAIFLIRRRERREQGINVRQKKNKMDWKFPS